jgi:menaquinone-dependent protoporphyrinogen IX oxidase
MKALILYRSYYGNTRLVAEAMAHEIEAIGHEVVLQDLRKGLPELSGFSCALIGAPTRIARVTRRALGTLKKLGKRGFAGKPVAIFDVYGPVPTTPEAQEKGKKWITPGAAGIMEKTARDQRLKVYGKTLRCEITGMKGPLKEQELKKAAQFARQFVEESLI